MTTFTYHLRRPKGGNQDTRERKVTTFCGAPVTAYDLGWRDKAESFVATRSLPWDAASRTWPEVTEWHVPCVACVAAKESR